MFDADLSARIQHLVLLIPGFLVAITVHEFSHGWIANRFGDPTAKLAGRLTFNPISHLDLFGTIFLVLTAISGFGIGWAKPVPVDPRNLSNPRSDMMWISLGGPAANIVTATLLAILLHTLFFALLGRPVGQASTLVVVPLLQMLVYAVQINVVLAVFNLIPIPPLDGAAILEGILPRQLANQWERLEPYGFIILIVLLMSGALNYIIVPPVQFITGILLGRIG